MICAPLFRFDEDAGLHAILVLTIEAWGRCDLNVTFVQTSETNKKKKTALDRLGWTRPISVLN